MLNNLFLNIIVLNVCAQIETYLDIKTFIRSLIIKHKRDILVTPPYSLKSI